MFARRSLESLDESEGRSGFRLGDRIWVDGRPAVFSYHADPGTAVVRYHGEDKARVVPLRKLADSPPVGGSSPPGRP